MKKKQKDNSKKTVIWLLLLITMLGLFLRVWHLDHQSIWVDEAYTIFVAEHSTLDVIKYSSIFEPHPPLYYLVIHYTMYFGKDEFILRFPSVVFGIITILVSYLLAKELFNRKVGLITALILSLSPVHVWMSQELRNYAFITLLLATAFYLFVKLIKEGKTKYLYLFTLVSIISFFTHYFTLFLLLSANIYIFSKVKKYRYLIKKWTISQIIVFLFVLLWIPIVIQNLFSQAFYNYRLSWFLLTIPGVFNTFSIGRFNPYIKQGMLFSLNDPLKIFTPLIIVWLIIITIFAILFIKGLLSTKNKEKSSLLLLFLFVPLLIPVIANLFFSFNFGAKRIMYAAIIYYIILAKGIVSFRRFANIFIIFIVISSTISLGSYYYKYEQEDWRSAVSYINENAEPDDVIIYAPVHILKPILGYYYKAHSETTGLPPNVNFLNKDYRKQAEINTDNINMIDDLTSGYKRLWFIENRGFETRDIVLDYLNQSDNFQFIQSTHYTDNWINIYLYAINS